MAIVVLRLGSPSTRRPNTGLGTGSAPAPRPPAALRRVPVSPTRRGIRLGSRAGADACGAAAPALSSSRATMGGRVSSAAHGPVITCRGAGAGTAEPARGCACRRRPRTAHRRQAHRRPHAPGAHVTQRRGGWSRPRVREVGSNPTDRRGARDPPDVGRRLRRPEGARKVPGRCPEGARKVTVLTAGGGGFAPGRDIRKTGVVKSAWLATLVEVRAAEGASTGKGRTREAVARLLMEQGPITAAAVAAELDLSAAAVRRHLDALLADGEAEAREAPGRGPR